MKIEEGLKLDFSNVLICPKRSTMESRSQVVVERTIAFPKCKQTWTGVPIIAANMDTVGTFEMYHELSKHHMLTCFHKFYTIDDYKKQKEFLNPEYYMLCTGIREEDFDKTALLIELLNPKFLCIDVANGYSHKFIEAVTRYRKLYPNMILVGGNVVTVEMVQELCIGGGLDIVKIGIGSGSACKTRIQTGCGYPQLSAVSVCSDAAHGMGTHIISDGGITCPGDVVKAFGGGADFVMIGGFFAGHDESGGELVKGDDGVLKKTFYGMSSDTAMNKHYGKVEKYRTSEGRTLEVNYKGAVSDTIQEIMGGLRSACTYIGARRIKDIPKCTTFIRVTQQVSSLYL